MKRLMLNLCLLAAVLAGAITFVNIDVNSADDFLGDVARGNMAEIALSQAALTRSQNE